MDLITRVVLIFQNDIIKELNMSTDDFGFGVA